MVKTVQVTSPWMHIVVTNTGFEQTLDLNSGILAPESVLNAQEVRKEIHWKSDE